MLPEHKKKLVVILGMHRSGTSLIARSLQVFGLELGSNLMEAALDQNDKGFWEDLDIYRLNEEILTFLHSDWHHLSLIDNNQLAQLKAHGFHQKANLLLAQKLKHADNFAFKDPRVTKLLPFWKQVFLECNYDISYILVIRNPFSVVNSLARRDGFLPDRSYLLWLSHVIVSLIDSSDYPRTLIDYDIFVQSPEIMLHRIEKDLNLNIDKEKLQNFVSDFLDDKLRHNVYTIDDLKNHQACPKIVENIYQSLHKIVENDDGFDGPEFLSNLTNWHQEVLSMQIYCRIADSLAFENKILKQQFYDAYHSRLFQALWKIVTPLRRIYQACRTKLCHR